ncbi:MAG TPA: hypothetical protein VND45_17265 [Thermoanaerobaculia bacterium]|jgi:uncharacterized protein YcbK (DUF882 family)|nr:hypothetical protein [Thermoanaerobaculia bacterium]
MAVIVVLLYVTMWVGAIVQQRDARDRPVEVAGGEHTEPAAPPPSPIESITRSVSPSVPKPTYLSDHMVGFLHPLRGISGDLRYAPALPGSRVVASVPGGATAVIAGAPADFRAPAKPGIYEFAVKIDQAQRPIDDISIVTLVPRSQKRGGKIGTYQLGTWPFEGGGIPRTPRYAAPPGFIQVTRENQDFQISEHFRVKQFLTKDQFNVWPKYVFIDPLLVDKLELTIAQLQRQGVRVEHVHVMSGFRTPRYNSGGGNTAGRANLSRHMYGDAADVYVDNNHDGQPDDITGDGRVTVADAEKFARAAEAVEGEHRTLVGGIGIYVACCGHGPFTHVDVRGSRARWRGSGSG